MFYLLIYLFLCTDIYIFKLWKRASIPRFSVGRSVCLQHEILDEVACGGWMRLMGGGGRCYGRELKRLKIKIKTNYSSIKMSSDVNINSQAK